MVYIIIWKEYLTISERGNEEEVWVQHKEETLQLKQEHIKDPSLSYKIPQKLFILVVLGIGD
jgi:hypothetical protein